jgi:hypothetical protein
LGDTNDRHDVQMDWPTVAPLGDTLGVPTTNGVDDRWVKAFEVVLDEHRRRVNHPNWGGIDFDRGSGDNGAHFVVFVRKITPAAKADELRQTVDRLVQNANAVAKVGTHVYELARELREPAPEESRESAPPPPTVEQPA